MIGPNVTPFRTEETILQVYHSLSNKVIVAIKWGTSEVKLNLSSKIDCTILIIVTNIYTYLQHIHLRARIWSAVV